MLERRVRVVQPIVQPWVWRWEGWEVAMWSTVRSVLLGALILAAACDSDDDPGTGPSPPPPPPPPPPAICVSVDTLPSLGPISRAHGINEAGLIVGASDIPVAFESESHAVLWQDGILTDLGLGAAHAINDAGWIVGTGPGGATLWRNGVATILGTLGGSRASATGINNSGWIVGTSQLPGDSIEHAFLWRNGSMIDLGTLGGSNSAANAINAAGQIVGASDVLNGREHAFLYENGVMRDLGTLQGHQSAAEDINDAGHIVGSWEWFTGGRVFLWRNGVMTDIGDLLQYSASGHGIDEHDRIVGALGDGPASQAAFLWVDSVVTNLSRVANQRLNATARDLNSAGLVIGWTLGDASDPNYPLLWDLNCSP